MIFSKEQTTLFLSQIVENFEDKRETERFLKLWHCISEDADFSLKDFGALSIF